MASAETYKRHLTVFNHCLNAFCFIAPTFQNLSNAVNANNYFKDRGYVVDFDTSTEPGVYVVAHNATNYPIAKTSGLLNVYHAYPYTTQIFIDFENGIDFRRQRLSNALPWGSWLKTDKLTAV